VEHMQLVGSHRRAVDDAVASRVLITKAGEHLANDLCRRADVHEDRVEPVGIELQVGRQVTERRGDADEERGSVVEDLVEAHVDEEARRARSAAVEEDLRAARYDDVRTDLRRDGREGVDPEHPRSLDRERDEAHDVEGARGIERERGSLGQQVVGVVDHR